MKVPCKIVIHGDRTRGQMLYGVAKSKLAILEHDQSLGKCTQEWRTDVLDTGEVIECCSSFNMRTIHIHTYPPKRVLGKRRERECFCSCHLSKGTVIKVTKELCCYDYLLPDTVYDVEICIDEWQWDRYVLVEGVSSLDFSPIEIGQKVLVVWAHEDKNEKYSDHKGEGCSIADVCSITPISVREEHYPDFDYDL